MKFDRRMFFNPFDDSRIPMNDPESYLTFFDDWFRQQVINTIGIRNIGRPNKRALQPLSYACVDFSNSRGKLPDHFSTGLLNSGLLHIHAVVAIRPGPGYQHRLRFLAAGHGAPSRRFGDVKVEPFNPSRGSLENMIEYISKGARVIGTKIKSETYDVFPRHRIIRRSTFVRL